jgi:hypothetical protein
MFNSGFIPSMDGTENIYDNAIDDTVYLPTEFSYMKNITGVLNQGSKPICVPCSLSAYFEYKLSLTSGKIENSNFKLYDIYDSRSEKTDGMQIKEAIEYVISNGAQYENGVIKANKYYAIKSKFALRHAIVTNGPCIIGLPVHNTNASEFWEPAYGSLLGYHAVAVVGYDKDGFIIRNSWGSSFGRKGYAHIKNEDIDRATEIWTIC